MQTVYLKIHVLKNSKIQNAKLIETKTIVFFYIY